MPVSYTRNFSFTKGRPGIPRISDANLDIMDEELANAQAYPFVPNQPLPPTREFAAGNVGVEQRQQEAASKGYGVGIKTLEVGPGLVLRDQGDGCFIIELAKETGDVQS